LPATVAAVDSSVPISHFRTVNQIVAKEESSPRSTMWLFSIFAGLALFLGVVGSYGVLSWSVAQRTREIGIRIAVGAPQGSVLWLVLRETLGMIACGVVLGVPAVLVLARLVKSVLYGLTPEDPLAISAAVVILMCGAAMAAYLPARRASRVDPIVALRYE
jgi:ABC-type antimicrobial peptide transport system permease subunit